MSTLRETFIQACRDVAADVRAGARFGDLDPFKDGCPHCAIGQVAARCGVGDGIVKYTSINGNAIQESEAYALFKLMDVAYGPVYQANDGQRWEDLADELESAASYLEAQ